MIASFLAPAAAKFEFAECRGVERIAGEASAIGDRADLFKPTLGSFELPDRDRSIESDDR